MILSFYYIRVPSCVDAGFQLCTGVPGQLWVYLSCKVSVDQLSSTPGGNM